MIQKRRLDTIMGILKDEGMVDVKTLSQRLEVTEKSGWILKSWKTRILWNVFMGELFLKSRQCH